jgi:hypothetical protein
MKFGGKRVPLLAQLGFFRAKFHSKSLYSVEKKIVGIWQYAYFSHLTQYQLAGRHGVLGYPKTEPYCLFCNDTPRQVTEDTQSIGRLTERIPPLKLAPRWR